MGKRSWAWQHYQEYNNGLMQCNVCAKKIKSDKCTTNMIRHLKVHNITEKGNSKTVDDAPYAGNNERKKRIDELILNLFIKDLQPFSIVEDKGFIELISFLDPKYRLPNRKQIKVWINEKYICEKEKVKNELEGAHKICITTDAWTSINTDSFLTVTCHFINHEYELKTYTIETSKLTENHTANIISNKLENIFESWSIQNKIAAVVTDNAPNMLKAVKSIKPVTDSIACFAHTLNLIVKNSLASIPEICVLRSKCRRLVTHFKLSPFAKNKLCEAQNTVGVPDHKLILEVDTRWNSTYQMFERLKEQQAAILLALASTKFNFESLHNVEWDILEQITFVLRPFYLITNEISTANYVNLSKIILLKKQLDIFVTVDDNKPITSKLRFSLRLQLQKYLSALEVNERYSIATLLDPRYKSLGFSNDDNANRACKLLHRIVSNMNHSGKSMLENTTNMVSTLNEPSCSFWATFDMEVNQRNNNTNSMSSGTLEIESYMKEQYLDRKLNPLLYWKKNSNRYPILSQIAKEYLCVMATSVPAERVFSKAGNVISKKRNRLKPTTVNMILFLNSCTD